MDATGTLAEQVLSPDACERAIERAFVGRLVAKLSTSSRLSSSTRVEGIVKALDSGQVDEALEAAAPPVDEPSSERFEDVREFDFDQWSRRRRQSALTR
jgi:hypothetical protein